MDEPQHAFDLQRRGVLLFAGTSPVSVFLMQDFLARLDNAYAYLAYHANRVELAVRIAPEIDDSNRRLRAWELRLHDEGHALYQGMSYVRMLGLTNARALGINRVELNSPGFWEIIGSLNPLAQVRGYLADRHERNKDRDYRNDAEKRQLNAEARLKELEVQRAEVAVAREKYELAAQIVGVDDARKLAITGLDDLWRASVWEYGLRPQAQVSAAPETE